MTYDGTIIGVIGCDVNKNTVKLKDYDGKEKYFVTAKIKSSDWVIGFSVPVSYKDEVKKLAQESKESVSNIKDTILKVQKAFENISRNSESILNFVHDDINNEFELFGKLIEEYYEDTKVINKMYKETAVISKELETAVSESFGSYPVCCTKLQKSAEDSEEISESIEKTLSAIKRIASAAEDQSRSSDRLNLMVEKFKL